MLHENEAKDKEILKDLLTLVGVCEKGVIATGKTSHQVKEATNLRDSTDLPVDQVLYDSLNTKDVNEYDKKFKETPNAKMLRLVNEHIYVDSIDKVIDSVCPLDDPELLEMYGAYEAKVAAQQALFDEQQAEEGFDPEEAKANGLVVLEEPVKQELPEFAENNPITFEQFMNENPLSVVED